MAILQVVATIVTLLMPCDGKVCPYGSYGIYACVKKGDKLTNCQYVGAVTEETMCKTVREDTA